MSSLISLNTFEYNSNEEKLVRLKAIAASQSNKISAKYSAIDSQQLIDDTMTTLQAIGLTDVNVSIDATGGTRGTKHFINFRLNDLAIEMDGGLTPRIIIENSYLGECAASISVGIYRFVCSNGLILGEDFFEERIQHVSGPKFHQKIGGLHSGIASAVNAIKNDLVNLVSELQSLELSFAEQLRLIVSLKMSDKLTESVVNRLYVQSSLRNEDRPKNVWTTYNIINEVMRESTRSDYAFTSKNINLLDDIRRLVV